MIKERTGAKVAASSSACCSAARPMPLPPSMSRKPSWPARPPLRPLSLATPGKMVAFKRAEGSEYKCEYVLVPLTSVANYEKKVPAEWITPDGTGVTQEFIDYALPLIQGSVERRPKTDCPATPGSKKCLLSKDNKAKLPCRKQGSFFIFSVAGVRVSSCKEHRLK